MTSGEIVTIIAAVAVALTQVISAWRTNDSVRTLTDKTELSSNTADKKLDAIHTLTNSNLTTVKADLAIANERIAKLEGLIQDMAKGKPGARVKAEVSEELAKKPPRRE